MTHPFEQPLIAVVHTMASGRQNEARQELARFAAAAGESASDIAQLVRGILIDQPPSHRSWLMLAGNMIESGLPLTGAEICKVLLATAPAEANIIALELARALLANGQSEAAEAIVRRIRRTDGQSAERRPDLLKAADEFRTARNKACDANLLLRANDPERFDALATEANFPGRDAHPLTGRFGRAYYPAFHGSRLEDMSFLVADGAKPVLLAECNVIGGGATGYFDQPAMIRFAANVESRAHAKALPLAISHLISETRAAGARALLIADQPGAERATPIGMACMKHNARFDTRFIGEIDLTADDALLRRGVRDSYRSLINWGTREMTLRHRQGSDAHAVTDSFFALQARRWPAVTDAVRAAIDAELDQGRGAMTVAHLPETGDVAATLVIDNGETAVYVAGHYFPPTPQTAVSHWPLWEQILAAKARGCRSFDLGEVQHPATASEKRRSIAFFKRGFARRIHLLPHWQIDVPAEAETLRIVTRQAA